MALTTDEMHAKFSEQISLVKNGGTLSEEDTKELITFADTLGGKWETKVDDTGKTETCMWICNNNFSCNPDNPPPNCNCHKVCW